MHGQASNGMSIWQQITKELSKFYSSEVETNSNTTMKASSKPTMVPNRKPAKDGNNETDEFIEDDTSTDGKSILLPMILALLLA